MVFPAYVTPEILQRDFSLLLHNKPNDSTGMYFPVMHQNTRIELKQQDLRLMMVW